MASLEITSVIGCPLACTFCPQDALSLSYGSKSSKLLSLDNFIAVVNKLPPHVRIDFSGYSEPFANPQAIKMVEYAISLKNDISIFTTLQGLRKVDVDFLVKHIQEGRFHDFMIHLPDEYNNMRGWKNNPDYMYALESLLVLKNTQCMTMSHGANISAELYECIRSSPKRKVLEKNLPIFVFKGNTRAGSLNTNLIADQEYKESPSWSDAISCASTPFYDHNVLLPDGRVSLCANDYGLKHVLGNLITDSYESLTTNSEKAKVIAANSSQDPLVKQSSICTECNNVCKYKSNKGSWEITDLHQSTVSTYSMAKAIAKRLIARFGYK